MAKHNYGGHSWRFIQQLSIGLFSGLAYLHENDIIHLDIKPENILVRRNAPPSELSWSDFCICDLGLCEEGQGYGEPIVPDEVRGTPGFIAPELCTDPGCYDGRAADVFSAGITLIDVLYGPSAKWDNAYILMGCDADAGARDIWKQLEEFAGMEVGNQDGSFHGFVCSLVSEYPPSRPFASEAVEYLRRIEVSGRRRV
uniref:Protein kinase domain-containing protein n=1 Tax=Grammatophora oceanica TaxID=210454 RepID=A0A7S1URB7_9STRA